MENEIESSALPPVSSLRSRFEALSRGGSNGGSNPSEEMGTKQGGKFGIIGRGARNSSRPTTPSVVVSPAASSDPPQAPLRRVVSSPSQPTSPDHASDSFASKQHFFTKVHSSSSDRLGPGIDGDEDLETPSSATPRKTPSTPNFTIALTSSARNSFGSDLDVGVPSVGNTPKASSRPPSGSSLSDRNSTEDLGVTEKTASLNTDIDDLHRKLARKPPPPPPGKKGPPPPPPRSTDSRSTTPSSRSETPSLETDAVPQPYSASFTNHFRSDSTSSASSFSLAPPPLPSRSTPSPNLPPRPTGLSSKVNSPIVPLKSPPLPPRSTEGTSSGNTLFYHSQDKGFKTPSAERLATPAGESSDQSQLSITPPKLPHRNGNNSAFSSPVVASGPPLPPRVQPSTSEGVTQAPAIAQAPRLPPRSNGILEDSPTKAEDLSTAIRRLPPPIPGRRGGSAASSRESLVSADDATSTTLSASNATLVEPAILPPPTRTVPPSAELSHSGSLHHSKEHKHHHFAHLPRQINSLPITKILAAVKLGSSESHGQGSRSPHAQQASSSLEASSEAPVEWSGTSGLLPPPTRTLGEKLNLSRPGSSAGRHRTRGSDSSDEEEEQGNLSAPEEGAAASTRMRRPISKVGEELPDSSKSNRRPPRLEEFQHAPNLYAPHHHVPQWKGADDANGKGAELRVPAHTGVAAVAGWWVVIASPGVITITNMNPKDRDRKPIYSTLDEYDLVDRDEVRDASGSNGVWTIEMKDMPIEWKVERPRVTAMEFRHGSVPRSNQNNGSKSSLNNSKSGIYSPSPSSTQDSERAKNRSDEGRYLWCGTRDGCLFELDIWNGGKLTDLRIGAHSGHVTGIYRLKGNRMLSIDEHGKCLVFCGNNARSGEQRWLSDANPRIQRIPHKEGFIKVLNGRLWTSSCISGSGKGTNSTNGTNGTGSGESKVSLTQSVGGSFTSLKQSHHHHHRHHKERASSATEGPIIRVYDVDEDGALVMKVVATGHNVGAVTSGTMLQCTPGLVYLGHEGGWVTLWNEKGTGKGNADEKSLQPGRPALHRHDSFNSSTSSSPLSQTSDDETEEGTMIDSPITFGNNGSGNTKFPPPPSALVPTVSTDGTGPVCIKKLKISISDVISLEGVGSRLWAGNRKGMIYAYDVTGGTEAGDADANIRGEDVRKDSSNEQRPWIVTNVWKAHGDLPVSELRVDPYSLDQVQRLVVYSVGRDERICFWDGFLSQNWIDSEMLTREQSYCTFRPLKLLVLTWNVDAAKPDSLVGSKNGTFFQNFLANPALEGGLPDIIVVGFQEVIDLEDKKLTAKTVLLGSTKKKLDGTISEKVSRHYRLWHDRLVAEVHRAYPAESYIVQHTENMVGLFTCVFVRRSVAHPTPSTKSVRDIAITTVKTGMYGMYGNKGAIVARFTVDDSSFCFLNCHLAAGQSQKVARNVDVAAILEEKAVFPMSVTDSDSHNGDFVSYVGGGDGSMVLDHELCFLNGDLNYRIDQRRDTVISSIQSGKYTHLLQYDQLNHELLTNPSFRLHTFVEPRINFAPTYKYDRGTNEYDSSEKRRIPAWCDRILYRCRDPSRIQNLWYGRYEPDISDHRPVCGVYRVVVKKIVPEKRTRELGMVRKMWNKEQLKLCADARAYFEEISA